MTKTDDCEMHTKLTDCDSLGFVSTVICTGSEGPFNKDTYH